MGSQDVLEGALKHEGKVKFEDIGFTELKEKLCRKKNYFLKVYIKWVQMGVPFRTGHSSCMVEKFDPMRSGANSQTVLHRMHSLPHLFLFRRSL